MRYNIVITTKNLRRASYVSEQSKDGFDIGS